jgi:hypothetical protein
MKFHAKQGQCSEKSPGHDNPYPCIHTTCSMHFYIENGGCMFLQMSVNINLTIQGHILEHECIGIS